MPIFKVPNQSFRWLFAELAVVVLGILIAFQIDTWKTYRQERAEEEKVLDGLYRDIEADLFAIRDLMESSESRAASVKKLLQSLEQASLLSAQQLIQDYLNAVFGTAWEPRITTYIGLRESSRLDIIQDETLRNQIISYYESEQSYVKSRYDGIVDARDALIDDFEDDFYRTALDTPIEGTEFITVKSPAGDDFKYSVKLPVENIPRNPVVYVSASELYYQLSLFNPRVEYAISLLNVLKEKLRTE